MKMLKTSQWFQVEVTREVECGPAGGPGTSGTASRSARRTSPECRVRRRVGRYTVSKQTAAGEGDDNSGRGLLQADS